MGNHRERKGMTGSDTEQQQQQQGGSSDKDHPSAICLAANITTVAAISPSSSASAELDDEEDKHKPAGSAAQPDPATTPSSKEQYVSRKPLWWRRQARKPSKAQRRLLNDPTTKQRFQLDRPKQYGDFLDWNQVFSSNNNNVWLELGFGLGDNLLRLSEQYADVNFVGSEVHAAGTATAVQRIVQASSFLSSVAGIDLNSQQRFWKGYSLWRPGVETDLRYTAGQNDADELSPPNSPNADGGGGGGGATVRPSASAITPYSNLRFNTGDGTKLLACIPNHSLTAVLVTFPDPFEHQPECRLLQVSVLKELWRVLVTNGGRLYLATDHAGYHTWSHHQIDRFNEETPTDILFQPLDPAPDRSQWLPVVSKYERKGWSEGRTTHLSCWQT